LKKGCTIKALLFFLSFFTLLFFSACAEKELPPATLPQQQISITQTKDLYKALNLSSNALEDNSYFYPLSEPRDAFASRIFLIDNAKKSIDVQYYIYEEDISGAFFSYHLLKAANRGVKVRILIDDLDTSGKDKAWLLLATHPNITIKVFNPIHFRKFFRFITLALHIDSLGRRMHNKALIVDNSFAIIGGRNIGNTYYATGDDTLFLDFDVLSAGKVNKDIEKMFTTYWQSSIVEDASNVLEAKFTKNELIESRIFLDKSVSEFAKTSIAKAMLQSSFLEKIKKGKITFIKANAAFFYDLPEKITTDIEDNTYHISREIEREFKHITKSILIISPYFIPTQDILQKFQTLRNRGVSITIITNSLASTDVFIVYSAYQKYIKQLLSMGVKIYELKPNSFQRFKRSKKWIKQNRVSLHTKLMILDEQYLTIGSANLDPRSIKLNTETFMIIDSTKMAQQLLNEAKQFIKSDDLIEISWGEVLVPYSLSGIKSYGIIYTTTEDGVKKVYYNPPYSSFLRTVGTNFLSYLPIDGYL